MRLSESIVNLSLSLSKFQEEVSNPSNTAKNPQFNSKYAPLDVVINTAKPILAKNGLSFVQSTGSDGENIVITTMLIHETGEWIESDPLTLPAYQIKKGGAKEFNAQGAGSSITYARRYSLSAILGLSSEDDDDGNANSNGGGYKDSSSKPNKPNSKPSQTDNKPNQLSDDDKEKRRQEAIDKAKARSNTNATSEEKDKPEDKPKPTENKDDTDTTTEESSKTEDKSDEMINSKQIKAINNLLNVLTRKKGEDFNSETFLETVVSEFGATELEEITFDQAKEVLSKINTEMRSK